MQAFTDSRFPTDNINLAAALAALHIPVKSDCPCTRTRDEAECSKEQFSFFFEAQGVEFCGAQHDAEVIAAAWGARAVFERENPRHPLIHIRKGLDARDWINRAANGEIPCGPARRAGLFSTDDAVLSACWKAAGGRVLEIVGGKVVFDKPPSRNFLIQYRKFNDEGHKETPVALMRRAVECRAVFKELYLATRERLRRVEVIESEAGHREWSELLFFSGTPESEIAEVEANL